MKAFIELIDAIEEQMYIAGTESIDYSEAKEDRFTYDVCAYVESKNNFIGFEFDVADCGTGFHVTNIRFDENYLPNITAKLNRTTFIYE
jgi:hypothetical protein